MKEAKELIEKYKKGLCTPDELVRLEKWFHHLGETEVSTLHEEDLLLAKRNFERHVVRHLRQGYSFRRWRAVAAAAAVIVALGVSLYFYLPPKGSIQDHALSPAHQDVAPGTNSAIITLPTGQSLHLAEDDHGSIAQAAGLKISRGLDGELRYEIED